MKAITVRNLPAKVAQAVRERAKKDRTSLSGAVIRLLEERLRTPPPAPARTRHHDLDFLYGTWTKQEADEFDQSLAGQRAVDPDLWK